MSDDVVTKEIPLVEPEKKPYRWQKIAIALGSMALALAGLVYVANAEVGAKQDFAELVKAFGSYCSLVTSIAIAAIIGNVGEHWKPAIQALVAKVTGQKGQTK